MKLQLIMLPNPILVSDEEIKEGCSCYHIEHKKVGKFELSKLSEPVLNYDDDGAKALVSLEYCKKTIAGIPELPSIDFSILSEEDCKKIGWVDVEKLATDNECGLPDSNSKDDMMNATLIYERYGGFIKGFKAAQSLNEKKFSEDDMIRLAIRCWNIASKPEHGATYNVNKIAKEFIQSLSQPKVFDVEVEMEDKGRWSGDMGGNIWIPKKQPKITNNSIKILKVL